MTIGLPVSRLVNVQVNLTALLAQQTPIDTLLIVGTSTVINVVERMREYTTLSEVAADFGTTAPEYLAAVVWFGQSPQPTTLFIGRWANTATHGKLIGGSIAAANLLIGPWNAITSGGVVVAVDGAVYALSGLNFSTQTNLNGVASVIQTALLAAGAPAGTTVVYNAVYTRFEITSGSTGTTSTVSFVSPSAAVGKATFAAQPTAADTLTINGTVITFVGTAPTGNQVLIGATLADTLQSLQTLLNSSIDANLSLMTYSVVGSVLYITAKAAGTAGNAYTLAKVSTNITVSGATLAGGSASDISAMLATTAATSGAYVANGIAAESALTAVTIIDNQYSNQWYGLVVPVAVDTDHQAIAAYCEAANPPHYYGLTTSESGVLSAASTSDIAYILSQLKYNKTAVQYSSTSPYAIVSYLARILTTNWLGQNTTITLMYKQEPGIAPETLNTNQANAAQAKNCNAYVNYSNNTSIIEYGQSVSGQFTDTVVGADWLSGNIQNNVFNTLLGSPKIPQTDQGMTVLLGAMEAACIDGVNNGFLGSGQWNSAGFGTLKQGQQLEKGYYAYAPPMATQSQPVRETRAAPVAQIAAKTAGAIHTSSIVLSINP